MLDTDASIRVLYGRQWLPTSHTNAAIICDYSFGWCVSKVKRVQNRLGLC
jgi:hypothetical protein